MLVPVLGTVSRGGTFAKSKRRPGWTPYLKRHVVDRYNEDHGASIPYKQNVGKLKPPLDRAHIYGFAHIQNALLDHVQGNLSEAQFRKSVLGPLYASSSGEEYDRVVRLIRAGPRGLGTRLVTSGVSAPPSSSASAPASGPPARPPRP